MDYNSSLNLKGLGLDEKELDYIEIKRCKTFHFKSVWGSAVSRILKHEIHRFFPEFKLNKRKLYPKEKFKRVIDDHYMEFSKNAWDSICTMGIVIFRYLDIVTAGGAQHRVPVVVGGEPGVHYKITTWFDPKTDGQKFSYYRLHSRRNGLKREPIRDKNVMILSNFGYNPNYDGSLTSITSTLLAKEFFINRMTMYTLRAEHNRSDPMIFAQADKNAMGVIDPSTMFGHFGDIDPNSRSEEARFKFNDAEIRETIRHTKEFFEAIVEESIPKKTAKNQQQFIDINKPQIKDNFFPLPMGYNIVPYQMPESRKDWESMNKIYQEEIFAAYSIPRQLIMPEGSGKLMGNADMARKMMSKAINHWRTMLSQTLTKIYCSMYEEEDCVMSLEDLEEFDLRNMTLKEMMKVVEDSVMTISFPTEISIDFDQMVAQFAMGILDWEDLNIYTLRNSEYNMMDFGGKEDTKKDPWDQQAKLSMLKKASAFKHIQKTGAAGELIFGIEKEKTKRSSIESNTGEEEGKEEKENDGEENKKKKKKKKKRDADAEGKKDEKKEEDKEENEEDKEEKKKRKREKKEKEPSKEKKKKKKKT